MNGLKKFLKTVGGGLKLGTGFSFSLATLGVYLATAFIFGHQFLAGLLGSDTAVYLSRLKFLADYFPRYPFWDPIEGAGVSALYGYPILTQTVLIITSKLTSLNLIESLKVWGFLSVPLFAFGIFVYVWVRFRLPLVAFFAGFFYILAPISRIWLHEWGFYAESVASVFFPFTILFFDLFILRAIKGFWTAKTRLFFVLTTILLGLSFLAHPTVFFGTLAFIGVYSGLLVFLNWKKRGKVLLRLTKYNLALVLISLALIAFWFLPFFKYNQLAASSSGGGGVFAPEYYRNDLELKEVLSFTVVTDEKDSAYAFRNFSFPLAISLLYLTGLFLALFMKEKKVLGQLLASVVLLLVAINAPLRIFLAGLPLMRYFSSWRILIYGVRLFVPIGAAFGAYALAQLLLYPLKLLDKVAIFKIFRLGLLSFLFLVLAFSALYYFRYKPLFENSYGYGLRDIWNTRKGDPCVLAEERDNPYCQSQYFRGKFIVQEFREACAELDNPPPLCRKEVNDENIDSLLRVCDRGSSGAFNETICRARVEPILDQVRNLDQWRAKLAKLPQSEILPPDDRRILAAIPDDEFIRYDTSPLAVRFSKTGPFYKKTPQMTVYITQNSLVNRMWGYQMSNFYADDSVYADPSALPEIAQWFGIKYMIVDEENDPTEKLYKAGFKKFADYPIFEFENAEPLVTLNTKPTFLVIGREDIRVYDEVFIKANFGLVSYDEATLIKGEENVDDYTLGELKKFDILFLHGYKYKNRNKAWRLLDQYVKEGGRLFIDTGWQFTSADWDAQDTASFFPTTTLNWTNFGKTSDYQLRGGLIDIEGVEISGFEPLIWNEQPWGVSSGDTLRDWAKPILTVQGHLLVAGGQYGSGRVIWSGMNTLGHISEFDSTQPEMIFASKLMDWLLEGYSSQNYVFGQDFTAKRERPDRIEFIFNKEVPENSSFYFKESYYPYWRAALIAEGKKSSLPILRAGPGFMFVQLPKIKSGNIVEFFIVKPWVDYAAILISLFTISGLAVYFFKPEIVRSKLPKLKLKNPLLRVSNEEDDY